MLDGIVLENFKAFRHEAIALSQLTLLSGLNATGKSTVMQAIAVLRQSHEAGFLEGGAWVLNAELVDLGTGQDLLNDYHSGPHIAVELRSKEGLWRWRAKYTKDSEVLELDEYPDNPCATAAIAGASFQYLRADRVNPAVVYGKSFHAISKRRFLGSRGEYAAHFLSKFQDETIGSSCLHHPAIPTTPGLLAQVNAWLQELSPGVIVHVEEIDRTDYVRLNYAYGGSAGLGSSGPYRPTNVGFGLTYSLPIVIACLSTTAGGTVMIENPEAHLHPRGQMMMGQLMSLCAAAGVQVLVETHSDHVLNGIRLAVKSGVLAADQVALHFFQRDTTQGTVSIQSPNIGASGKLSFWPDGFFDQWDKSLDALLG